MEYKQAALGRIDVFLGLLLAGLDLDETQLAVISPYPPPPARVTGWAGYCWLAVRWKQAGFLPLHHPAGWNHNHADLLSVLLVLMVLSMGQIPKVYSLRAEKGAGLACTPEPLPGNCIYLQFPFSLYQKLFIFFKIFNFLFSLYLYAFRKK